MDKQKLANYAIALMAADGLSCEDMLDVLRHAEASVKLTQQNNQMKAETVTEA